MNAVPLEDTSAPFDLIPYDQY